MNDEINKRDHFAISQIRNGAPQDQVVDYGVAIGIIIHKDTCCPPGIKFVEEYSHAVVLFRQLVLVFTGDFPAPIVDNLPVTLFEDRKSVV